ncbi:MAG: ribbon-helix-helix domain-containing protein [Tannerellaceae bacterium]|jgi:metal-responsive CopG/Arc/MetJ family transcriptional regulator|nr:ribbon-helix-helix domain-containing protein [Tannerellaceae bacterium]
MATVTVPFQEDLLKQIDRFAADNVRSRVDVIVEATRIYVEREQNWQAIFSCGDSLASKNDITEADIMSEIKATRSR